MRGLGATSATSPQDEAALIARCKAGDRTAWRSLYLKHFDFVYRLARSLGTPLPEVEDVTQEVFTIAFRKLDRFQSGQLATWLYRICANVVTDHHRKRRVRSVFASVFGPRKEEPSPEPSPEGLVQQAQARMRVSRILERMSPKKREVFVLFELEGLSGDRIAERVGCPVDTVWTRLFHARKEFAKVGQRENLLEGMA